MDQSAFIALRFIQHGDSDGLGKLAVTAQAQGFAGTGSAWVTAHQLVDFAEAIIQLPLPTTPTVELAGGVSHGTASYGLAHEYIALRVFSLDHRGHVGIQVRLATELGPHDPSETQFTLQLVVPTTYAALPAIRMQLTDLAAGRTQELRIDAQDIT